MKQLTIGQNLFYSLVGAIGGFTMIVLEIIGEISNPIQLYIAGEIACRFTAYVCIISMFCFVVKFAIEAFDQIKAKNKA